MDTPADPATPLKKVYQAFFDDLAKQGTKPSTIERYRYDILRFEEWLLDNGHPAIRHTVHSYLRRFAPGEPILYEPRPVCFDSS